MATLSGNTLTQAYQGEGNLYVAIRQTSDGQAFDGESLVDFDADDLADYALALTSQGGDLYSVEIPDDLPAGTYQFLVYERAGEDPAADDLLLTSPVYAWDGESGSTPPVGETPEPGEYALTTLAEVKALMRITVDRHDELLVRLIDSVSSAIETLTNRQFRARDYRVRLDGRMQRQLVLPQYPLQHVTRIAYGNAAALTVKYAGSAIRATASVFVDPENGDAGGVRLYSVATSGSSTATGLAFDAYPTAALLVARINTVAGWQATLRRDVPAADLFPTAMNDCIGSTQDLRYPDVDLFNYSVNHKSGVVMFDSRNAGPFAVGDGWGGSRGTVPFPAGHQYITVQYRAGFEQIPAGLSQLAAEMVKDAYDTTKRDGSIKSRTIGPYSAAYDTVALAQVNRDRLAPWMNTNVVVGGGA